ncbi:hypothetical protein [Actinomadura madurae]|uniref:hypothetical protein n=1 Tax=Actinomadura madurae TaxID=1993 RepID=UPI0020D2145B|nr:hypothetical protein [Actinomadura madurae]MCQ0016066.1 hypothetical protein [Actinomadura madurae]
MPRRSFTSGRFAITRWSTVGCRFGAASNQYTRSSSPRRCSSAWSVSALISFSAATRYSRREPQPSSRAPEAA